MGSSSSSVVHRIRGVIGGRTSSSSSEPASELEARRPDARLPGRVSPRSSAPVHRPTRNDRRIPRRTFPIRAGRSPSTSSPPPGARACTPGTCCLLAQDGVREVEHASGRGDRVHRRGPPVAVVHPERLDHQDAAHARRRDAYRRSSGQARPLQLAPDPSLAEPRGERGAARYRSRPLDDVRLGAQEHQVVRIEMGQPDTRHGYRAPLRAPPRARRS